MALLCLFVLAPNLIVVMISFSPGDVIDFPPKGLSLKWYGYALSQKLFVDSAVNSLLLALASTLLAAPVAVAAALAISAGNFRGKSALQTFLLAPLIVPAIVIGLSILIAGAAVGWRDTPSRLLLAHVLVAFPYVVRTCLASLERLDPALREAALTLGASPGRAFRHVTLPLIMPGVIAGMLFAFIVSFDNVSVSLFLATLRSNTLPLAILNYVEFNPDPSVAALSTLLIAVSLVAAVVIERMVGLKRTVGA